MNPILLTFAKQNNIGDNVVLFYLASLVKELLKAMDNEDINEYTLKLIFDGENNEI